MEVFAIKIGWYNIASSWDSTLKVKYTIPFAHHNKDIEKNEKKGATCNYVIISVHNQNEQSFCC